MRRLLWSCGVGIAIVAAGGILAIASAGDALAPHEDWRNYLALAALPVALVANLIWPRGTEGPAFQVVSVAGSLLVWTCLIYAGLSLLASWKRSGQKLTNE